MTVLCKLIAISFAGADSRCPFLAECSGLNSQREMLSRKNQVVAKIEPLPVNQQQREEVLGRIETAEAAKRQSDALAEHARHDYEEARRHLERAAQLGRKKVISAQASEEARNMEITGAEKLRAARFSAAELRYRRLTAPNDSASYCTVLSSSAS